MKGSFAGLHISHSCEGEKKRLSRVLASSAMLLHRNAVLYAEPAWHVALCRQVWAQSERNNTKIRSSVHYLLSSWYQNSQYAFGLSVEVLAVRVRVLPASDPGVPAKPRSFGYKRMYLFFCQVDLVSCFRIVQTFAFNALRALCRHKVHRITLQLLQI